MKPLVFFLWAFLALNTPLMAQSIRQSIISPAEGRQTIEATLKLLNEPYVFQDV